MIQAILVIRKTIYFTTSVKAARDNCAVISLIKPKKMFFHNIPKHENYITVNAVLSSKRTQSRRPCCQLPARKAKVKCLTLPFEVQSSIEEGQPRKGVAKDEAGDRKEK